MILPPASAGCLSGRCCATPSSRGFAASAGSGLQGPWRPCCIAAHPPCAISVCAVMLGGRPRGAGAFDRLCKAALRLLQTMPDTTATRELLARPPGSFQSEEQRRLLTDAATAWEAAEEGLFAAVGKLLAPLLRARADAELRPSVGEAALSLINRGLLPAGTLVPTEASLRTDAGRGGLPIGPVLRDALLEKLCGVSGLGSANALAAVLHAAHPPLRHLRVQGHARRQTARRSCV